MRRVAGYLLAATVVAQALAAPRALMPPQAGSSESHEPAPSRSAQEALQAVLSAAPDAKRGARLFVVCAACHGLHAEGSAERMAPALAGQHPRVIAKELVDYRYGIRWDFRMERVAARHVMPLARDIADIAFYLGNLPPERTDSLGDGEWIAQGRQLYTTLCVSCHGPDGAGSDARFIPRLAGQRYDYLLRQLHDAVEGRRPNMAAIHDEPLRKLDMQELNGLADYLSRLSSARDARAAGSKPMRAAIAAAVAEADICACKGTPAREGPAEEPPREALGCLGPSDPHGMRQALRAIYAGRDASPLWLGPRGPTAQALALLARLRAADAYGLRPQDYASAAIAELPSIHGPAATDQVARWARSDVALTAAALRLVADLHFGRVDPRQAGFQLDAPREPFDLAAAVERLAATVDVGGVLASIEPQFYHYKLLEVALQRYRELAERPSLKQLPAPARPVRKGDSYPGTPALRRLLAAVGDLPEAGAGATGHRDGRSLTTPRLRIDAPLAAAIAKFQARHGLTADGVLGKATYAALTTPFAHRVRQIELTLERWRWLPAFDSPPIIVNIPQFRLFAFRSTADRKASILQMDVIVGKRYPRFQTPVFAADMKYVVFRPYWDIPYSIMRREMLPEIRANPAYLAREHLEIVAGETDAAQPLPATAENIEALAAGKLRLRQQPGPDNALGLIKFMFPNHYNVYLHSTPAHQLFNESRRAFSHGCIRVSDPVALAEHVLRNATGDWTRERIQAAMDGARTQRVSLVKPIRVMILYGTVLATESGDVLFFDDIYGGDRRLEALLGLKPAI